MANKRYSREEVEQLLRAAATQGEQAPEGFSPEEVEAAAREAGIDADRLLEAKQSLAQHRNRRAVLVLLALAAVALSAAVLFLPAHALRGAQPGRVLLHNMDRQAYLLELLVPTGDGLDCDRPPDQRGPASDYCVWRRLRLESRTRSSVDLPRRPSACPQIWVRSYRGSVLAHSALFTLPAGIEIERSGRLDQKGAGRPHMHPPPQQLVLDGAGPQVCASAFTSGGRDAD